MFQYIQSFWAAVKDFWGRLTGENSKISLPSGLSLFWSPANTAPPCVKPWWARWSTRPKPLPWTRQTRFSSTTWLPCKECWTSRFSQVVREISGLRTLEEMGGILLGRLRDTVRCGHLALIILDAPRDRSCGARTWASPKKSGPRKKGTATGNSTPSWSSPMARPSPSTPTARRTRWRATSW
jgi:hypothetical protein